MSKKKKMEMYSSIASRFYDRRGKPQYEVKCKTRDGMRKPTIRDARTNGWVPSVTTVLKMLSKPSLDYWKSTQLLESALTHPLIGNSDIPIDDLVGNIIADSNQVSREAMELGTKYHDEIELLIGDRSKENLVIPDGTRDSLYKLWDEMKLEPMYLEEAFAHSLGFGGRVDCIAVCDSKDAIGHCVIDWKTQSTKKGRKANWYEDWSLQLAAYAHGIGEKLDNPDISNSHLISVIISTTEIGRVEYKVWDNPVERWRLFSLVLDLWKSTLGTGTDLSFERNEDEQEKK
jgi:hypothetical protein